MPDFNVTDTNKVVVAENHFNGVNSIDFRQYFLPDENEDFVPTKKGVRIPIGELPDLIEYLLKVSLKYNTLDELSRIVTNSMKPPFNSGE